MFLLNNTELFLLGISLIGFVILSLYYLIAYARPLRASRRTDDTLEEGNKLPVSIIIYAKNDSENLKKHLPALLTQDYPEYQVVVINDGSRDDTDDTLKFFQNEYKHLYHTYVPSDARYLSRRKLAFTLGQIRYSSIHGGELPTAQRSMVIRHGWWIHTRDQYCLGLLQIQQLQGILS